MANATGIGPALRRARLLRSKSIEEASRETRIRAEYLQAMERERFEDLLGDVYVRGFLRTYASYLGLDAEKVVAIYAGGAGAAVPTVRHYSNDAIDVHIPDARDRFDGEPAAGAPLRSRVGSASPERRGGISMGNPFRRTSPPPPTFGRRRLNWPVMIGVAVTAVIVLATAGLFSRAKTVPPPAAGAALPLAGNPAATGVTLAVEGTVDVRMTVRTDGQVAFHAVLRAGEGESFQAERTIEITLGRGSSATLTVNGQNLGAPGSPDRIYHAIFRPGQYRRKPSPGPSVG